MLNHIPTLFSRISRSIQSLTLVALALLLVASSAFAQYEVTVINQASSSATGIGASGIPSLTVNVPEGDNRAVFIISHFEREHCSLADDTASGCYVDSPLLSDNFANNSIDDNQTNMIISGAGGSLNKTNPLVLPDGDLRFLRMIRNYMGSTGSNGAFISRESYHFAIYESEIDSLLGGSASGNLNLSPGDIKLPTSAGDEASLIAIVFENVNDTNTGIVRSGWAFQSQPPQPGNFVLSSAALDAGQAVDDPKSGLLVYGFSYSASQTYATMPGFSSVLDLVVNNPNGHFPSNVPTYNETDGYSLTAQFRNGPALGSINSFSLQGASSPTYQHDGGGRWCIHYRFCAC